MKWFKKKPSAADASVALEAAVKRVEDEALRGMPMDQKEEVQVVRDLAYYSQYVPAAEADAAQVRLVTCRRRLR